MFYFHIIVDFHQDHQHHLVSLSPNNPWLMFLVFLVWCWIRSIHYPVWRDQDRATLTHWGLVTPFWRHRSGSTLAQVMACNLTTPSHYLNQCWLIISVRSCGVHGRVLSWEDLTIPIIKQDWKLHFCRITFRFPRGQWFNVTNSVISEADNCKYRLDYDYGVLFDSSQT